MSTGSIRSTWGYTQYAGANNPDTLEKGLKAILAESETYTDSQFVTNR